MRGKYLKIRWLWLASIGAIGSLLLLSECAKGPDALGNTIPDVVDFNFHVKPILSDRCFKCHGPDAQKREAGLRLDTKEGLFKALEKHKDQFVVVPGKPESSEMWRRLMHEDPDQLMPPPSSNLSLNETEKTIIRRWIAQGGKYQKHWAFIVPQKSPLPKVKRKDWNDSPIDRWVLTKMKDLNLEPNDREEWARLIRRVCLDLTGLPPTEVVMQKFKKDDSPASYRRLVDYLMKQPTFGERMAAHWLDVSRYADSHGYQDDGPRTMWPWRDWVIHAFNTNMPFDRFVTWQIAGDMLPNPTKEMLLATGFNRNHKITQEGGVIDEEYRIEYVTDRTNTFSKAFMGLTMECSKCHDHKYDPITQKEYYQLFSFFNSVPEKGLYGDISLVSLADPPNMRISNATVRDTLPFINKKPTDTAVVMIMQDMPQARPTFVLKRGQYDAPSVEVQRGTPRSVLAFDKKFSNNRAGLAEWLFSPKHPLTARVFVNRMWMELFGTGIVKSSEDFGNQGELPTHPELLDWLAVDFQEHHWDVKRLIREIVLSSTYQQADAISKHKQEVDPENRYLSRGPRIRMSAEMIRDNWLATSGLLNPEVGGPSVKPYQPEGLWEDTNPGRGPLMSYKQDKKEKLYRRSLYTFWKRTAPPPFMLTFDAPMRDYCVPKRTRTNTPLQALNMLNDPQMLEAARWLAARLLKKTGGGEAAVQSAFERILTREPESKELKQLFAYFQKRRKTLQEDPNRAEKMLQVGEVAQAKGVNPIDCAALSEVVQIIYNMDETITK
jgi:hypothetical protein